MCLLFVPCHIDPDKALFFQEKIVDIILISPPKHMLWVSLETLWQGASKYPQYMFSWRNKKNIFLITPLSGAMLLVSLSSELEDNRLLIFFFLLLFFKETQA